MWIFKGKEIYGHADLLPKCTNFVYIITYTNGKRYIGKKTVRSVRKKKPTKAQLRIRKNYVRKELTDLPFLKYEGSHGNADNMVIESKEIFYQCSDKKAATYIETVFLFHYNVLFDDNFLNENISGTFFDNSLEGLLE